MLQSDDKWALLHLRQLYPDWTPQHLARKTNLPTRAVEIFLGAADVRAEIQVPGGEMLSDTYLAEIATVPPSRRAPLARLAVEEEWTVKDIRAVVRKSPRARLPGMLRLRASGKTLREIGEIYGISRERVRQILSSQRRFPCEVCGVSKDLSDLAPRNGFYARTGASGI